MGGSAEASLARAARLGDGHIFAGNTDRHFDAAIRLVELLAEHGRDRAAFGMDMFVDFAVRPRRVARHAHVDGRRSAGR